MSQGCPPFGTLTSCRRGSTQPYVAVITDPNLLKDLKLATRTQKISDLAARLSAASQYDSPTVDLVIKSFFLERSVDLSL